MGFYVNNCREAFVFNYVMEFDEGFGDFGCALLKKLFFVDKNINKLSVIMEDEFSVKEMQERVKTTEPFCFHALLIYNFKE